MRVIISQLCLYAALGCASVACLGLLVCALPLSAYFWHEMLFAFWLQYGLMLMVAAILSLLAWTLGQALSKKRRALALGLMTGCFAGSLGILWPLQHWMPFWPSQHRFQANSVPAGSQPIRMLQHNVFRFRQDISGLHDLLHREKADIVALEEVDWRIKQSLDSDPEIQRRYPYRAGTFQLGELLYSRWPIESSTVTPVDPVIKDFSILSGRIQTPAGSLTVVVVHPPHPTETHHYYYQQDVFNTIKGMNQHLQRPLVVAGDLNATPFSPALIDFKRSMNLRDPREGHSLQPSWPSRLPWLLRLPIDHLLVSPDIRVISQELLPNAGSDHLPLVLTLTLSSGQPSNPKPSEPRN
jgi:endonuclease/exonuclease/phosphatase (EEP) superfamily protein YafD